MFGLFKKITGKEVTVANAPVPSAPDDKGERHSRLWINFLTGAVSSLEEELRHAAPERAAEIRASIAEKQREIAVHTALYPSALRDAEYLADHVRGA